MRNLIAFFVKRGLVVNMLSLMLMLGGAFAAVSIQREAFPSVNFDLVIINSAYPGTSPEEMDQLVVTPIERELTGIDGINATRSTSYPGSMQISIEIDPSYKDRSRLVSDVQQAINRADLPVDLPESPILTEIKSEQTPIISFTMFGDLKALKLHRIANRIEDDLLDIKGVARVIIQGDRKEEIRIVLNPARMQKLRISTQDVITLVQGWNINAPGGPLKSKQGQKMIRITGELGSASDAGNLVLRANDRGDVVRLKDVADIRQDLKRPTRYVDAMGSPAINMIVMKKGQADIISLVDRVRSYLKTIPDNYGKDLQVRTYQDFSTITRLRLGVLTSNGTIGLILVLAILLLFLRPAVALTTAWGLPVIFFSSLFVLFISGVTLNLLTMFGFIIALGLIVDDAIIIGENTTYHLERGLTPQQAAITGTYELAGPVTATVLTTIIAFLPLMFMQGIIGKFVFSIPMVVIVLLAFSLLEAMVILPNHICDIVNPDKHPGERLIMVWITRIYGFFLKWAIKLRYLTILLTLAALAGSLFVASGMKFQLFPSGAENQFYLRLAEPVGTTLEQTRTSLLKLDRELRAHIDPAILETTTIIAGQSSANERDSLRQIGDHFGFVRVVLTPFSTRDISALMVMGELEKSIPELFPDKKINFVMLKPGPPVGQALQVEISGNDKSASRRVALRLIAFLKTISGVHAIESGLEAGDPEIHIVLDRPLAAYAQVNLATVATHIKAAFGGLRVSTLKRGKEEVDVTLRYPESAHRDIKTLMSLAIPNKSGGMVPLSRIARLEEHPGLSNIRHKDGNRVIAITAEVDSITITSKALNNLVERDKAQWLGGDAGKIRLHMGGEQERTNESMRGLIFSFAYALLGIFVILAIQFNRLSYPILVMFAIPFGAIGIVTGLHLHGQPLSFMSMMGFVALSGVVVNSSLVLAVFIQRLMDEGKPWREAVMTSGKRRLRAVLLTTMTTVVGLLPTAYGWGGYDPFVAAMALALSWGLLFSTAITLLTIPAAFGIGMDLKNSVAWFRKRLG